VSNTNKILKKTQTYTIFKVMKNKISVPKTNKKNSKIKKHKIKFKKFTRDT